MKFNLLVIIAAFCFLNVQAQNKPAKPVKFTSVYTNLNTQCKSALTRREEKESEANGQDTPLKCKGYGGYQIYFSYSVESVFIYISDNLRDGDASINLASQNYNYDQEKNRKIEWRLADGKPFAVILRVSNYDPPADPPSGETHFMDKYKTGESLLVKGLRNFERIDAEIDSKTPSANQKARQTADDSYLEKN